MKNHIKSHVLSIIFIGLAIFLAILPSPPLCAEEPIPEPQEPSTTTSTDITTTTQTSYEPKYTEDELFCLAAAIYNEAGGNAYSDDTRRLVGYVILNRVNHSNYPNTIREVLEQPWQYGRFCVTGIKFADRHTSPYEKKAVERAYRIAEEVLSLEYIPIPDNVVYQAEFQQGTSLYKKQDGIYFCCL